MSRFIRPSIIAYNGYDSGLGNRVRVVLGAKALADLEDRSMYYVWPTGKLFGPTFTELWNFHGARRVSRSVSRALAKIYPYNDAKLSIINDAMRSRLLWQIRTGGELELPPGARSWRQELRQLVPSDAIGHRVTSTFEREFAGTHYIGVMIRAHSVSHRKTRDASPVDWFIARMRDIRAQSPDVPFFISCDVPEVQQQVVDALGGCFGLTDKGGYNSTEGVQSSICDLYLLASSGYMIGPHWSSFIHLAEYLCDNKVVLETSMAPRSREVDFRSVGLTIDPLQPTNRLRSSATAPGQ